MIVRARFIAFLILALLLLFTTGCATVAPDGLFPREHGSRVAEKTWLTLHAVDTMQTVQIARRPECYRESNPFASAVYGSDTPSESRVLVTNVALAFVHSAVSRWFDDNVAASQLADDGNVGGWYVGRIAWHTVSLLGTGGAVIGNFSIGLTPTSARCP